MKTIQFKILIFLCVSILIKCNSSTSTEPDNNSPVISDMIANPDSITINETCEITCIANDTDGDNLNYSWESAAGIISGSGSVVSWTAPDSIGEFFVRCRVSDGNGGEATENVNIMVMSNEPSASFTMDKTTARIGEVITFTNTSKNTTSYEWDFGDGNSSTEENPTYAYSDTGSFIITLTAHGEAGSSSVSKSAKIEEPVLILTFNGDSNEFEGPTSFKTGNVTFFFYNQSSGLATMVLLRHDDGYSHQDMLDLFTNGYSTTHSPSWSHHLYWNVIDTGTYSTWTIFLMPGLYSFLSFKDSPPNVGAYYGAGLTVYE